MKHAPQKRLTPLPYLLLLPTMLLLAVFTFYPFLRNVYLSLFITDPLGRPGQFVGLENFSFVLKSEAFKKSLVATGRYAAMICAGTFFLAMFFAFLCAQKTRGSKIYQTMFALPISLASVPIACLALYILSRNGLLNGILGTTTMWLSQKETALPSVAAVAIWANLGTSFIFLLVGFRNVPDDLLESSMIDGASYLRRFFSISLPIASPQIFFVLFLNILTSFKSFALINLLTESGPAQSTNVLMYAIYSNAFYRHRFEIACVYSLILSALIFAVARIQFLFEKRLVHYQ